MDCVLKQHFQSLCIHNRESTSQQPLPLQCRASEKIPTLTIGCIRCRPFLKTCLTSAGNLIHSWQKSLNSICMLITLTKTTLQQFWQNSQKLSASLELFALSLVKNKSKGLHTSLSLYFQVILVFYETITCITLYTDPATEQWPWIIFVCKFFTCISVSKLGTYSYTFPTISSRWLGEA